MLPFKKHPRDEGEGDLAINRISRRADRILNLIFLLWALACVLPLILVVIVSFSSEQSIFQNGYSFFPSEWSLDAYRFFFRLGDQLVRSYGITIFVTVAGTLFSLIITAMFAYVLSRADYAYNRLFTLLMLFTMLFNGGIVATYMVNTQILGLGNSLGALIFPMSLNAFYVIVLRTFYKSIPMEIIEAARIDGAGEFKTFFRIVTPLSKPGLATIGMFTTIAYWNDWFLGMLYIIDQKKYPVQTLLWSMQNSLEFMKQSSANALEYAEMAANAPTDSGRMALTVLVVLPILLAYPFFQKYFVKGLTVGGVKG
ncbi:sugar ABC transporter permease [Gemmiger sp. An120]|uniref:carbohydrate ABC transporter permease n=1 Tax=Gemmiger sp. An120 TaxID=1965549 RepID=UPI000B398B50|nr:carbohydrate ABC transporter permease [Gemmiger sp. An120]OUQ42095.1 sugar ABC transporter permease [Gemmiger sp. An120]HIX34021.1 carbohydrate ABC transporter permease [Candidatus Gemmiger avium]